VFVFLVMEMEKEPFDGDIAGGNLVTRASETSGNQGACGPWVNPGWMDLRPWECGSLPDITWTLAFTPGLVFRLKLVPRAQLY
jgi:hypothetical protein